MNKKLDKIGFIIIILTIIMLNIFIGSNIKQPIWIIQAIVSTFSLIYIILKKMKREKNVILKGKVDIAVLLFMITMIIPYILKTYVSLEGTCNFILKYWSVYGLYILTRNTITDDKQIKILLNSIIVSSIIPIILGFDKMTFSICEPFLNLINSVKIESNRMISTFGYANTFAIYLTMTASIAIAQFINTKKRRNKVLYGIYIVLAGITILLTQSKAVLALIALTILIFGIKGIKEKKISKKVILIGIGLIVMFFVYFFIAIQISKPLEIGKEEKNCVIRGVEPSTKYEFNLEINSKTDKTYNVFDISIIEITRHFSEIPLGRFSFSNFAGNKIINIETTENADHIEIRIKNQLNQELTIKGLQINGEDYILEYAIIPDEIVRIFTTFNFKNSSVWQRADYWKDGFKIINDHCIFGAGGNAWRMLYGQKQDYLYYAKEAHSYLLEVWMSFGLLGIFSYILIITISVKNGREVLKENKDEEQNYRTMLSIIIGVGLIAIHSIMDFDMSYLIMEMMFFMMIAIINKQDKKMKTNLEFIEIPVILIFAIVSIANIQATIATVVENEYGTKKGSFANWISRYQYNQIVYLENYKIEDKNEMDYIKEYITKEPYQNQNTMYEIMSNQIIKNVNVEDVRFLIETWKNVEVERKYEIKQLQQRAEIMLNLAENLIEEAEKQNNSQLKEEAERILEIIQNEYKQYRIVIADYERNREIKSIVKFKYEYYTNIYDNATKLLETKK